MKYKNNRYLNIEAEMAQREITNEIRHKAAECTEINNLKTMRKSIKYSIISDVHMKNDHFNSVS